MKSIALIGSTGSIGTQTCSVVRRHPDKFRIAALVAGGGNAELFLKQAEEFRPEYAALADERAGEQIKNRMPAGIKFACGEKAAEEAVGFGDTALIAAGGFAGLKYSLAAIRAGRDVALANKETLVCGGELVMREVRGAGVRLLPVDSEHSAIWQALSFRPDTPFKRLIITASGGPFYAYTPDRLARVTPADALRHPTWKMGAKITIDSATLLNKGFEVIEAGWLYDAPLEKIHTIVQPESIIHSMVEFADGAVLAQMSFPSMELPIQLALTYPDRLDCGVKPLDFQALGTLHFLPLERRRFPCYDLALTAAEKGKNYPCALNGAGEVAVHAFLQGRIGFTAIAEIIADALAETEEMPADSYEALSETDARARQAAERHIARLSRSV